MTTARVSYRTYVPSGWIALEFCNVKFYEDNTDLFKSKWYDIQYEKCRKYRPEKILLFERRESSERERDSIIAELDKSKQWWRFWNNNTEKELKQRLSKVIRDIDEINLEMKAIEENSYYSAYDLTCKAEKFLNTNGFVLKSSAREECATHIDIWELKNN